MKELRRTIYISNELRGRINYTEGYFACYDVQISMENKIYHAVWVRIWYAISRELNEARNTRK